MKLVRFAFVNFEPRPILWKHWGLDVDGIKVGVEERELEKSKKLLRVIIFAEVKLDVLPHIENDILIVPEQPRKSAERAIEHLTNLVSVSEMCKKSISSSTPCVAFIPENEKERKYLEKSKGYSSELKKVVRFRYSTSQETIENNFEDRLDGYALLSEALSNQTAIGKFHEYMRLFERAFTLSSTKLIIPLSDFLKSSGYTKDEINDWIYKYRHPATHADKKDFILESDIRPIIPRIEQAAYEILFNKIKWRDPSTTKHSILEQDGGSKNGKEFFVKMKKEPAIDIQLLDHYEIYPVDSHGHLEFSKGWWMKTLEDLENGTVDAGTFHIDFKD